VIDSRRRPVSKDYVNIYLCVLKKIIFYFKLIFFIFLDYFNMLILKIILKIKNIYYFNKF
jgi:hypothetical protein